ncbi:MAG: HipA domain-containing protein, partial [Myxococcota bacterium]
SLAGLQLKFVVERDDRGLTVPARGRGARWILKLPDPRHPRVPENEAALLGWARASGIEVPAVELVDPREVHGLPDGLPTAEPALLVRRFDRGDDGTRTHLEDFAEMCIRDRDLKYDRANYETIGKVLVALAEGDLRAYVRRLVFMVLSGNADLHLKNWSVQYLGPFGRDVRLAPAYDLVPTVVYPGTAAALDRHLGTLRLGR